MAAEGRVLRVVHFRPVRAEFDEFLRGTMVPDLRRLPGLEAVYVGRRGGDQEGDRVVASVWTDRQTMIAGVGETLEASTFHADRLPDTTDRLLEIHDLAIDLAFGTPEPPTLMRVFRAVVKPGELDAYIDQVRAATQADAGAGRGPCALYLAADPPDGVITVSLWPSWEAIETATGGDIHRPTTTKDSSRLASMEITHFEVVAEAR